MKSPKTIALSTLALAVLLLPGVAAAQTWSGYGPRVEYRTYAPPPASALVVEPGMSAHAFDVLVTGDLRCRDVTGTHCRGFVSDAPVQLVVRHRTRVTIDVSWATIDTVLALVGPSGTFTDDDGGRGNLSRLDVLLAPGVHYLYIGTRHHRRAGQVGLVIDAERRAPRVVVVPGRPAPPHVVVVDPPPRRVVVYDDEDSGDRRRHGRGHGHGHHDD